MAQNITLLGASYPGVPAVLLPKTGGGTARFADPSETTAVEADVASGKRFLGADGEYRTGTASGGGGMNVQAYYGSDYVTATSYTDTDVSLTVAKAGTYRVSWVGWRNTNSGTSGSQLYRTRNGTTSAIGTAQTTFTGTYGQVVTLTNQQFQAGDVLTVRARARSTSYQMHVANLIIEQTA